MKKLAFLFVAVAAISFASCGNGTQATEETTDTVDSAATEVVEDTTAQDTAAADTAAADTAAQAAQ